MIAICEPQCKFFSHEKFNSGFLYGLRLAYPHEILRFYGDASHIEALKKMLIHDKVSVDYIEYVPIKFRTSPGLIRAMGYRRLLVSVFRDALGNGADKILFLSFNPEILYLIKRMKQKSEFHGLKFTLVLHGGFESIANDDSATKVQSRPQVSFRSGSVLDKLKRTKLRDVPSKTMSVLARTVDRFFSPWNFVTRRSLSERKMLLWKHSGDFRYICLSSHVKTRATRYIDVEYMNFYTVTLPTVFAEVTPRPKNEYVKFAIFGYGNSPELHKLLIQLSQLKIEMRYEIRIIGMDSRGTMGFQHVTCPSPGRPLDRTDMEWYAQDIDMFLILYDKSRYQLSCSGSILESLSYLKPVLHLDNECINSFNRDHEPIGIRCDNLNQLASRIKEIAENYSEYGQVLDMFRDNMLKVRRVCSIEQSVSALRESFTW